MTRVVRSAAAVAVALIAGAPAASAQIDADRYRPSATATGYFRVDGAELPPPGAPAFALGFALTRGLLVLRDPDTGMVLADGELIETRVTAHLAAAVRVTDRVELGGSWAAALQTGDGGAMRRAVAGSGVGDLQLRARYALRAGGAIRVTAAAAITAPIGSRTGYLGEAGWTLHPSIVVGLSRGRVAAAAELGYRLRPPAVSVDLAVDDEVTAGLAARYAMTPAVSLIAELDAAIGVERKGNAAERPVEVLAGVRVRVAGAWWVQAGAGAGFTSGYGAPDARGVITLAYAARAAAPAPAAARTWTPPEDDEPAPPMAPIAPEAPAGIERAADRLVIAAELLFEVDDARLRPDALAALEQVLALWASEPAWDRLRIEGHADRRGAARHNQDLSERRAEAVRRALIDLGADPSRLDAIGLGASRPRSPGLTADDHARDRRVELVIVRRSAAP
jgi:outer membrane protein OmpA-like peptidoglycan-associated protein